MSRLPSVLRKVARRSCTLPLELLYPSRCFHCGLRLALEPESTLCTRCRDEVEPIGEPRCPGCAGTFDAMGVCPDCLGAPLPFERVIAPGKFAGTLRPLVHGLKFGGRYFLALPLGELLAAEVVRELGDDLPTHVVPMPLARLRRLRRGYNQAELIAREVARRIRRPLATHVLHRRGWRAKPQTRLDRVARERNVRDAYRAHHLPTDATVLLVDDVVTTARTITAAALALERAGATRIVVACAARATLRSHH